MPNNQKSVDTYVVILFLGVVFYGFAAINALWKRPLKIKFEVSTKYSNQSISQWKYGQIESMKINLQLSKYRLYISLGVLAALFIAAKILVTPDMVDVIVEIVETLFIILFFVTIVFFVIDIVLWIKRGKFAFITIKPLFIMALIILLVWFLP
jgi:membrane-associated HD superfamily phosphohydrolase